MDDQPTNAALLADWRAGRQDAATRLVDRYLARLTALVRARLSRRLARRVDPEDVVLSAWRSFFVVASNGRVSPGPDGDLWPLLATITLRKLARQATRQRADRRSFDREESGTTEGLAELVATDPTPEDAAAVADEVEAALARLDGVEREVFVRRLRGESTLQIAQALSCSDRTVRRAAERIREILEPMSESDTPAAPTIGIESVYARGVPPAFNAANARRPDSIESSADERTSAIPAPANVATFTPSQLLMREMIGEGGFGKVYRATLKHTGETVAVKYLRKRLWTDRRAVESLLHEAGILAELSHPGIVGCRGWGRTMYGAVFLVTDSIDGVELAGWARESCASPREIAAAVSQVADAVAAAHRRGILHGDLKPSNVLRRSDGTIVLTDFGFARRLSNGAAGHFVDSAAGCASSGATGGTAGFLAPEQVSDAFGSPGPATDVYGLGGLLFALLTGQPPMLGRDVPEVMANVLSSASPPPPSRFNTAVPPTLDDIVAKCLRKEPTDRYAQADDVAAALRAATSRTES